MIKKLTCLALTAWLTAACSLPNPDLKESKVSNDEPETIELISRELIFGNADKSLGRISPDGQYLSWIAPHEGVMNIWVAPTSSPSQARLLTQDKNRGIQYYYWAYDNSSILYPQDNGGNENDHLYAVDVASGEVRDLTDIPENAKAQVQGISAQRPNVVLVGLNTRDSQLFDLYEIDIKTGERTLVIENPGFGSWVIDNNLQPTLAM